jgi:hypothetical protein
MEGHPELGIYAELTQAMASLHEGVEARQASGQSHPLSCMLGVWSCPLSLTREVIKITSADVR